MKKIIFSLCLFLSSMIQASDSLYGISYDELRLRSIKRTLKEQQKKVQAKHAGIINVLHQIDQVIPFSDQYFAYTLAYNKDYVFIPQAHMLAQKDVQLRRDIIFLNNQIYKKQSQQDDSSHYGLPSLGLNVPCHKSGDTSGISTPTSSPNSGLTTKSCDCSTITSYASTLSLPQIASQKEVGKLHIQKDISQKALMHTATQAQKIIDKQQDALNFLIKKADDSKLLSANFEHAISGIIKFQSRYRGFTLRHNHLGNIQLPLRLAKQLREDALQRAEKQKVCEQEATLAQERIRCLKQTQRANNFLKKQERQKQAEQNIRNQELNVIIESLDSVQEKTLANVTKKERKLLKSFYQSINQLVRESDISDNVATVGQLATITQQSLNKYVGIDSRGFANCLAIRAFKAANFDECVEHCGRKFDADKILNAIIQPTYDQEHFQNLSQLLKENNIARADQQTHKIIDLEKQLLLGSFALAYKKAK